MHFLAQVGGAHDGAVAAVGPLHDGARFQVISKIGSLFSSVLEGFLRVVGCPRHLFNWIFIDPIHGVFGLCGFAAQIPQLCLGFDYLPFEGVVLVLADIAALKLRLHLFFRVLQRFQLDVGLLHFLVQ